MCGFHADRAPAETDLLDERGVYASEEGFNVCCRIWAKYTPLLKLRVITMKCLSDH
jgi:hypothetical protein